jgi:hypothetical protein
LIKRYTSVATSEIKDIIASNTSLEAVFVDGSNVYSNFFDFNQDNK